MRPSHMLHFTLAALVALSTLIGTSCQSQKPPSASAEAGKVPVTTKSDEARKEFLQGQDFSDRLLAQDSIAHFDKAIALDPAFALAELGRATSSATAKDFFDHLNKAVSLSGGVSEGERLLILATQAGANGDTATQKEDLEKLVAAYPDDERAQVALGNFYFGQQDFANAIQHYKRATEVAPKFSPAYNILGYAYRQNGDYADAEQTFKKYTELIPNDPNPYDSYAELLLKMGRFDDSITQYRKALSVDPQFNPSHFGIAADLLYMDKSSDAMTELQKMAGAARNDGELRTALFGMAVVDADGGKTQPALDEMDKQYAIAEKKNDAAGMAGDLLAKGNILLAAGKFDEAAKQFEHSLQVTEASSLSQEIKDNTKLQYEFNLAEIAIGKKDYAAAKQHIAAFQAGAKNTAQMRQSHELAGRLALAQKDYDTALAELQQANLQDPRNLYRLGDVYRAKGDSAKAHDYYSKAATFNSLPQLNYAFIRKQAQKMAGAKT
ncbi:MAG TPA: tetratricopeptide repeat protein [Terriglobales bacterium]|nr:tetratricopeptide repeat protein [Terriglobales bacterium]